jgi:hypothetical protein
MIAFRFKMTVRVDFLFLKNEYGGQGLQDLQESRERGRLGFRQKAPLLLRERIFLSIQLLGGRKICALVVPFSVSQFA